MKTIIKIGLVGGLCAVLAYAGTLIYHIGKVRGIETCQYLLYLSMADFKRKIVEDEKSEEEIEES